MILKCWHRPEKAFVSTDQSGNVLEVQVKHPYWQGCDESAGLLSRGMCVEVHRELGISAIVPNGIGRDVKPNGETNEDIAEVGSAHSSLRTGKPSTWQRG